MIYDHWTEPVQDLDSAHDLHPFTDIKKRSDEGSRFISRHHAYHFRTVATVIAESIHCVDNEAAPYLVEGWQKRVHKLGVETRTFARLGALGLIEDKTSRTFLTIWVILTHFAGIYVSITALA
jgi:hypothetical protein